MPPYQENLGRETQMTINSMITGAHAIIYSQNPEADRAFLREFWGWRTWTWGMAG